MSGEVERAVIDASVVLPLVLDDPRRQACLDLLDRLQAEGSLLLAPSLFAYETTNGVTRGLLAGGITPHEAERALQRLDDLSIHLITPDLELRHRASTWTQDLRRTAAYDSFYLAVAERHGCDLWTTDQKLVRSADLPWVRLVPPG